MDPAITDATSTGRCNPGAGPLDLSLGACRRAERPPMTRALLEERFLMIDRIEYRWSGQVMESFDGIAFIGRNPGDPRNVSIATGDPGMGMTHGTIAGMLITDSIMGRECSWVPLHDPARKTLRASLDYARENINVAVQYVEDYLTGGDVDSSEEIARGEGAIIRRGLTKLAVYLEKT